MRMVTVLFLMNSRKHSLMAFPLSSVLLTASSHGSSSVKIMNSSLHPISHVTKTAILFSKQMQTVKLFLIKTASTFISMLPQKMKKPVNTKTSLFFQAVTATQWDLFPSLKLLASKVLQQKKLAMILLQRHMMQLLQSVASLHLHLILFREQVMKLSVLHLISLLTLFTSSMQTVSVLQLRTSLHLCSDILML